MTHSKKKRTAEIQEAIRQVLLLHWDPVGAGGKDWEEGEYDRYIDPLYEILTGSRSEWELVELLISAEPGAVVLPCESLERWQQVARKLLEIDVGF